MKKKILFLLLIFAFFQISFAKKNNSSIKIFDLHADILNDIYFKSKKGEINVFENYHLNRFKKGEINGGIFVIWLPQVVDDEKNGIKLFSDMVNVIEKEEKNMKSISKTIENKKDLKNIFKEDKIYYLKGIEGLRIAKYSTEIIDILYSKGYRHIMLTWNESNALATGTRGDKNRGVTELGKEAILKMNKLGMIVDVSHLNEQSFWDVLAISKKPVIASHSSSNSISSHVRNLTDEQIKAIAKKGGVIGVNSYKTFVSSDNASRTVEKYVDHIEHIISVGGIDSVALGFDFCEYLPGEDKENLSGLKDASEAQNVIDILYKRGYSKKDIEKISYKNVLRVLNEILPKK